jgi:hypothetical protein
VGFLHSLSDLPEGASKQNGPVIVALHDGGICLKLDAGSCLLLSIVARVAAIAAGTCPKLEGTCPKLDGGS